MNRAERRKAGVKGGGTKTYIFHSKKEIVEAATKGVARVEMEAEITRQILAQEERFRLDMDASVLWTLHVRFGFGPKRLKEFYKAFVEEYHNMRERFEMDDSYPERYKLKQIGVDVEELMNEKGGEKGGEDI